MILRFCALAVLILEKIERIISNLQFTIRKWYLNWITNWSIFAINLGINGIARELNDEVFFYFTNGKMHLKGATSLISWFNDKGYDTNCNLKECDNCWSHSPRKVRTMIRSWLWLAYHIKFLFKWHFMISIFFHYDLSTKKNNLNYFPLLPAKISTLLSWY